MCRKVLFVNSCARENSRTKELAQHLLNSIDGEITCINLFEEDVKPLDINALEKRIDNEQSGSFDCAEFERAKQFSKADVIVVAAPFWDLSFPSVLKIYLENITVSGITFEYSDKGHPIGKCRAKKLYYITTSGGYIGSNNFGFEYVKGVSETLFGISDISFFSAEGLDVFGADVKEIMDEAKKKITNEL